MIGHCIRIILKKRFWHSDPVSKRQDLKAVVHKTLKHKDGRHPEAIVMIEEPNAKDPSIIAIRQTEILISQDPAVD